MLVVIAVCIFSVSEAQTKFSIEKMKVLANTYFKAYEKMDFDTMATLYHTNIIFEDQTYIDQSGKTAHLEGGETIKKIFKNYYFPKTIKAEFKEDEHFFSGIQGVFRGQLTAYTKGSAAGASDDKTIVSNTSYVIVLTFAMQDEELKIIRHTDYVNYATATRKWAE